MTTPIIPADQWPEDAALHTWDEENGQGYWTVYDKVGGFWTIRSSHIPMPDGWDWRVPVTRQPAIDLEQFRRFIHACGYGAGAYPERKSEADRLLALIDAVPKDSSDAPPAAPGIDLVSDILTDLSNVAGSWVVEAAGAYADAMNDCASQMHDAIERWSNRLQHGDARLQARVAELEARTVINIEDVSLAAQMLTWGREEGLTVEQKHDVDVHAAKLFALIDGQANVRSSSEHSEPALIDRQAAQRPLIARQLAEWHEDDGPAMWWAWCGSDWAGEPAWCGTPNDSDWPGYHTHWTPHPAWPMQPKERGHG